MDSAKVDREQLEPGKGREASGDDSKDGDQSDKKIQA
jgi:hypothetical protein